MTEALAHALAEVIERDATTTQAVADEYAHLPALLRLLAGPPRVHPPDGYHEPPALDYPWIDLHTLLGPFATLLGPALGATGTADSGVFGEVLLRTSPAAGARRPVEAYVCALNVEGLPPGVYHYAVLEHALERLEVAGARLRSWRRSASRASVERSRWKYPFGRMYRTMMLDLGHIAQTFTLTATALGLASFQTAVFKEPPIEELLWLNPAAEPLLHAVGAGPPPTDGAALFWDAAQSPGGA